MHLPSITVDILTNSIKSTEYDMQQSGNSQFITLVYDNHFKFN